MVYSADISSIVLQIFMIWLFSTFFSKKKKKKGLKIPQIINDFYTKVVSFIEDKFEELDIIPKGLNDEIETAPIEKSPVVNPEPRQRKKYQNLTHKKKNINLRTKLGLNSKSNIKNAIIVNEILGKPLSLRK